MKRRISEFEDTPAYRLLYSRQDGGWVEACCAQKCIGVTLPNLVLQVGKGSEYEQ